MQTTFREIDLNLIRYSLVWEDYSTIQKVIETEQPERVAMITSAGCNVLNVALSDVKEIHAIDLNPTQNLLLAFKIHLTEHYPYATLANLIGLNGADAIQEECNQLRSTIDQHFIPLLDPISKYGMLSCGKLERYIHNFLREYPRYSELFKSLISSPDLKTRQALIADMPCRDQLEHDFSAYFNAANLSKGRDPQLFKYSPDDTGRTFFKRLMDYLSSRDGELPFSFRFFFFGMEQMPQNLLPPAYQEKNQIRLRQCVKKIISREAEAIEYLTSEEAKAYDLYVLSNIFEYCDHPTFQQAIQQLQKKVGTGHSILYWNLLNEHFFPPLQNLEFSELLSKTEACFYFHSLQLLQS